MNEKKLTARQYLEQLKLIDEKINQDLEELEAIKLSAYSVGSIDYSRERVQTSCSGDSLGNAVTRYIARSKQINSEIDLFVDAKDRIRKQIQGLNNRNYIQVLFKIYVQYKSVKVTASEMKKSYSYVVALHKKALLEFEETYENLHYLT